MAAQSATLRIIMSISTPAFPPAAEMEVLCFARARSQNACEHSAPDHRRLRGQVTGHPLVLIGVLKGAAIFLSDLARAITVDNTFDFVAVSSYGRARVSSGAVKLIKDIDNPIEGQARDPRRGHSRHRPDAELPARV